MLDIKEIKTNPENFRVAYNKRGLNGDGLLAELLALDLNWREATRTMQDLAAELNVATSQVAVARKSGEQAKVEEIVNQNQQISAKLTIARQNTQQAKAALDEKVFGLPNVVLPEVPSGKEENNQEIRRWGTPRTDTVLPHWEIGKNLGLLDTARGVKISGAGFMAFREQGAALMRALFNFCLDLHTKEHGYEEVRVPSLVSGRTLMGTGQLPKFQEDLYQIQGDDLYLIPTAEVPVTNLYRDELMNLAGLPRGFVAHTSCFRREAGAAGKDTRGLLRLHEFDKIELVRYARPEDSSHQLECLTADAEVVLKKLGLPYRVILLAAGDTGFASAKTYDLEVWAPGVGKWLEVSSCSSFGDFQARRAGLKFKNSEGKQQFVHTLNGSGLAFPRTIAAILEHFQQPDGTVIVPEVLRPYLGTDVLKNTAPAAKRTLLRR